MEAVKLETYKLKRGNAYYEVFVFTDEDDLPLNLTSYTHIKQTIRDGITRTARELNTVSLDSGISISGVDNNIVTIEIDNNITDKWVGGKYFRDILFTINGRPFTYAEGIIEVSENIT